MNFNRRSFLKKNALIGGGLMLAGSMDALGSVSRKINTRFSALKNISITYTNDLGAQTAEVFANLGGLEAVQATLNRKAIKPLLFDAGGFLHATQHSSHNEKAITLMNGMDYHAVNLSENELKGGIQHLEELVLQMNFPLISANYHFDSQILKNKVRPYATFLYGKYKVGVTGVGSTYAVAGLQVSDPIQAANRMALHLKETEKCDLIICLTHLGQNEDVDQNKALATQSQHIDLFIGGHLSEQTQGLHCFKNTAGYDVFLSNNPPHGLALSHVSYGFDETGQKTGVSFEQDIPTRIHQDKLANIKQLQHYNTI